MWMSIAESMLIERVKPVRNRALDSFGNHDFGRERYNEMMSQRNCLHSGRAWAARSQSCTDTVDRVGE
jgi:hypothetical protein